MISKHVKNPIIAVSVRVYQALLVAYPTEFQLGCIGCLTTLSMHAFVDSWAVSNAKPLWGKGWRFWQKYSAGKRDPGAVDKCNWDCARWYPALFIAWFIAFLDTGETNNIVANFVAGTADVILVIIFALQGIALAVLGYVLKSDAPEDIAVPA